MITTQSELSKAMAIADRILDRPNADPDDDLAVMARQLNRTVVNAARILGWWRTMAFHPDDDTMILAERDAFHKQLARAIDPEGAAEGRYG